MKTVFSNNQVCHVWAQQKQEHGRNSNSTLYFQGTEIYSYGSHYLAAKFHQTKKGETIVLINENRYSPTTGQHLSNIRQAIDSDILIIGVPNPNNLFDAENIEYLENKIFDGFISILQSKPSRYGAGLNWNILEPVRELNKYLAAIGKQKKEFSIDFFRTCYQINVKNKKRYLELQKPENIEKREVERKKREERAGEKELKKRVENIENFKKGDSFSSFTIDGFDLIRVKGDILETSRKANVKLSEAIFLVKRILEEKAESGEKVGNFSFDWMKESENKKVVKIGCHRFLLSDGLSVLKQYL